MEEIKGIQISTGTEGADSIETALEGQQEETALGLGKLPQPNKYHRYPKSWDKSIAAYYRGVEMQGVMEQAEFHRIALKEVRKALKGKCTHLIHVTDSTGIITFKAKLNINGKTKIVNVDSQLPAKELVAESYRNLNNVLLDEFRS